VQARVRGLRARFNPTLSIQVANRPAHVGSRQDDNRLHRGPTDLIDMDRQKAQSSVGHVGARWKVSEQILTTLTHSVPAASFSKRRYVASITRHVSY